MLRRVDWWRFAVAYGFHLQGEAVQEERLHEDESTSSFETFVTTGQSTRCNISDDLNLHQRHAGTSDLFC